MVRKVCQNKQSDLILVIAEVSSAQDLFQEYGIDAFPVTILFRNGKIEQKIIGADENKIKRMFQKLGLDFH
jgi:thioredoxin-like negative regulator of GroEL